MGQTPEFDQRMGSTIVRSTPGELILRRCLAVVLLALAFPLMIALIPAVLAKLAPGQVAPSESWRMVFGIGGIACPCIWLALVLWSGRPIPRWFMATFVFGLPLGFGLFCLVQGDLVNAAISLGSFLIYWCSVGPVYFPPKPKDLPEL